MRTILRQLCLAVPVLAVMCAYSQTAKADCTAQDFAAVVDQSGASLRSLNGAFQPKLKDRMRRYQDAAGLPKSAYEDAALEAIQDPRLAELDAQSGELILKIDTLGRVPDNTAPDCAKLNDIKAASIELDAVVRTKSSYMLERLDAKIRDAESKKPASKAPPAQLPPASPQTTAPGEAKKSATAPTKPAEPKLAEKAIAKEPKPNDRPRDDYSASPRPAVTAEPEPPAIAANGEPSSPGLMTSDDDGYTIEEIRDATRGFFGTISTNLATVLEHAFKTTGHPTGYVLGNEGGGAFLAGLRYGNGTLYMRHQNDRRQVYWHGPSVGYDVGAEGGRTLFLIYKLAEPDGLYRSFTGIDGSAYLVGGVGITFLKGGDVIMAPIRSGLGLRLGANIGYVRFTDKPTWNPF